MNKLWKICAAAAVLLLLFQVILVWHFCAQEPRIELFPPSGTDVTAQVDKTGISYAVQDDGRVDVFSTQLFLAEELTSQIGHPDLVVNDRTQAGLLARQAVECVVFVTELWLFVGAIVLFLRLICAAQTRWRAALVDHYLGEIVGDYAVDILLLAFKLVALLLIMALLLLRILNFSLYLPQTILPEHYFLNFSQWFSGVAPPLPEITAYERVCRVALPGLYLLGAAAVLLESIAFALVIHPKPLLPPDKKFPGIQ